MSSTTQTTPTCTQANTPLAILSPQTLERMECIAKIAKDADAKGFAATQAKHTLCVSEPQAKRAIDRALDAGLIHKAGQRNSTRYFATAAQAKAWQEEREAEARTSKPKPRSRDALEYKIEAVRQAIIEAGDAGITTPEISIAIKRDRKVVREVIAAGQIGHSARCGNTLRHFATSAQVKDYNSDPAAHIAKHQRKKRQGRPAATAQPTTLAITSPALPPSVRITIKQLEGDAVVPRDLQIVQAAKPQPRISTDDADFLFSTLQPGHYLKADTWASRHLALRQAS